MKRHLFLTVLIVGVLALASTGWSVPLYTVGSEDLFQPFSADLPNSGDATEEAWIQSVLGSTDYTLDFKYEFGDHEWEHVDFTRLLAWQFPDGYEPEYYFIKVGARPGDDSHFMFRNLNELDWAVVDLADLNVRRGISHIGATGGATEMPEPSSLLLLGIGMAGIAGFRKKFA